VALGIVPHKTSTISWVLARLWDSNPRGGPAPGLTTKPMILFNIGGEASPVGRPDFKSGKEPLAGPWWVRLPLSSATTPSTSDRWHPITIK
jgi:hypothetical protein